MFGRSDIQPIGLDIGHDAVKLLQVEVIGQSLKVRAAARRTLDAASRDKAETALDAALAAAAALIRQNGFSGRAVVTALPREIVHIKNLRLPSIPAAELPAAVRFEAHNIFSFDTETAYVDYLAAGDVRQGSEARQEVIVLAARQSEVDDFVQRLDGHGLTAASLDVEPCAIYRSLERFIRRRDDENEVNVLLDIGLRRTQVLIGRGRELSFFKPIDMGGQKLNEAVAKRLGITLEEARALRRRLAQPASAASGAGEPQEAVRQAVFHATRAMLEDLGREVSLCLRYHSVTFRGPGPQRVRLLGGEAVDPNLREVLSATLSIPAEATNPLINVDCAAMKAADRQGAMSEWATALGLAMKKTVGRFAARDGKPRLTRGGIGEVIDINQAVASTAEGSAPEVLRA